MSLFDLLGLNDEEFAWQKLAACATSDLALADAPFDNYESDPTSAKQFDQLCRVCPVRQQCFEAGINGKETGVWGGIYLSDGKLDIGYNKHKTDEDWKEAEQALDVKVRNGKIYT